MKFAKLWAFAALSLVACAASQNDDTASDNAQAIALRSGNIDNAAIVEAGTMMHESNPLSSELDDYNAEDPFAIKGDYMKSYEGRLDMFDGYDSKADWTPAQKAEWLARITSSNYQIIDTSKPCDWSNPHTYLEIERAHLTGQDYQTCGGRMPNEDALDVTVNFLMRGPGASALDAEAIKDGVSQATKQSADTFPYLAEMN